MPKQLIANNGGMRNRDIIVHNRYKDLPCHFESTGNRADCFFLRALRFRMCQLQIEDLHIHDSMELGVCLSGTGIFIVEDKVMDFTAGDVIAVTDAEFHRAKITNCAYADWYFFHFKPFFPAADDGDGLLFPADHSLAGPEYCNRKKDPFLSRQLLLLGDWLAAHDNQPDHTARTMLKVALELLVADARHGGRRWRGRAEKIRRLSPALSLISHRCGEKLTVSGLAAACGMSVSLFYKLFQEVFGKSPVEYLITYRIRLGNYLIRQENRSIAEAAEAVGYDGTSTFYRHYKKIFGAAPSSCRQCRQ